MKNLQKQQQWIKQYSGLLDLSQSLPKSTFLKHTPHEIVLELERRYGFFSCVAVSREEENMYWQELKAGAVLSSCFSAASWVIKDRRLKKSMSSFMAVPMDLILELKTFNEFKGYFENQSYGQIMMGLIHLIHHTRIYMIKQLDISNYNSEIEKYIIHLCKDYEPMQYFLARLEAWLVLHLATDLLERFLIEKTSKTYHCCFFCRVKAKKASTLQDFVDYCHDLNVQYEEIYSDEIRPLLALA